MKKQTTIQKKKSNKQGNISGKSLPGSYKTTIQLQPKSSRSNTFLVQNIGKDPPDRARSPGLAYCLDPDNPPALIIINKTLLITQFQMFKQIQNPNILTINILQL